MLEVYLDKVTKGLNISQIKVTGRRYVAKILVELFSYKQIAAMQLKI